MRFGTVTLIGRSNVGKSTFLNLALGQPLSIVSPLPQTTRDALLGVAQFGDAQVAFLDTPGIHKPRTELGRRMNGAALDAARSADVLLFFTDVPDRFPAAVPHHEPPANPLEHPLIRSDDRPLLQEIASKKAPTLLVINKVDLVADKTKLLPVLDAYFQTGLFKAIIPTCFKKGEGLARVTQEIEALLPEGEFGYDANTLTNRPVLFFVREYIREALLNQLGSEVPHAVAVSIDEADERPSLLRIVATIHVEKVGQRKIVVGSQGQMIKSIGIKARERIEALVEKKVHLSLFVRVTPEWKNVPRQLAELGYDAPMGDAECAPPARPEKEGT